MLPRVPIRIGFKDAPGLAETALVSLPLAGSCVADPSRPATAWRDPAAFSPATHRSVFPFASAVGPSALALEPRVLARKRPARRATCAAMLRRFRSAPRWLA